MNAFSPTFKDLKSSLKNMLLKGIHSFEDGFEILDIDLDIDEHLTVDMMAKDARGNPTVVLMADFGEADLIHRILSTLCRLRRQRLLLQRIYRDHAFDFSVPPRILLLSPRFSDDFIDELDFIVAGDIVPYEYSSIKMGDKELLTFTRRDIEEGGEIQAFRLETGKDFPELTESLTGDLGRIHLDMPPPPEPGPRPVSTPAPRAEPAAAFKKEPKAEPAEAGKSEPRVIHEAKLKIKPDDEPTPGPAHTKPKKKYKDDEKNKKKGDDVPYEKFFHEAKKKILRISNDIIEDVEGPRSRFKIGNVPLVTLSKKHDELGAYLGDTDQVLLKIDSDLQLNEALNQIFKRYFTTFSSISRH